MSDVVYKDIPSHPGYRAGSDGSIWSCRKIGSGASGLGSSWRRITQKKKSEGYLECSIRVSLKTVSRYVHRLVLAAFVGPCPDGYECCHGDGDKCNNAISNLRWDTRAANTNDKKIHRARKLAGVTCNG